MTAPNNMMNMMKFIGILKNGGNPEQMILQLLENQAGNNPLAQNLIQLAKNGDSKAIESFARNIMKEKGLDFDKEFSQFKKSLGF